MTIETRRCANCASLNKNPSASEPLCWNLIAINRTDVAAGGVCDQHSTPEENAHESELVDAYQRLGCDWAVPAFLQSNALARRAVEKARRV